MEHISDGYGSFGGIKSPKSRLNKASALIQGIPYESGASGKKGASFAMRALRNISADMQTLSRSGVDIGAMKLVDLGDIPVNPLDSKETGENIYRNTKEILAQSSAPLISVGGDHSVTFPIIKAFADLGSVGVIWVDAHRDLLDSLINSKYSHGSSLRRSLELDNVSPENVLLIGTRYFTREEEGYVKKHGVNEIRKVDLELQSPAENIKAINARIHEIASRVDNLYLSIDIDVLDPGCAPGTGTPVAGGMMGSELLGYISNIPAPIRAYDIVEVSPPLDTSGITVKVAMAVLTEILAHIAKTRTKSNSGNSTT